MASTTKKPASGAGKSASRATKSGSAKTKAAKTTQAKAGAGPAIAERSKDAKPAFGRAAPKKVSPAAAKAAPRITAKADGGKSVGKAPAARVGSGDDSIGTKVARGAKAAVNVAAGAVVVAAKGAASLASSVKGPKDRSKPK
jgi:large subunit ribosomal protein L23Ae